jgi:hypothetical protein
MHVPLVPHVSPAGQSFDVTHSLAVHVISRQRGVDAGHCAGDAH